MGVISFNPTISSKQEEYVNRKAILGKDDFLKLLVAQIQYQDPLNPMSNTEFTAQLAQFSTLEQQKNMNEKLDSLISTQSIMKQLEVSNIVGKSVEAFSNEITLGQEGESLIQFSLPASAASAVIYITDTNGKLVRTLKLTDLAKGMNNISWDGRTDSGQRAAPGNYVFSVSAVDNSNSPIDATAVSKGRVEAVIYREGEAYLLVNGREIAFSKIHRILAQEE